MGWFSKDTEADAIKKIESINQEMREISAAIHLNYNMIDGRNKSKIKNHYNKILYYLRSYERIKSNLQDYERIMLLGATVDVWNGERVGVLMWEKYLSDTLRQIHHDYNY